MTGAFVSRTTMTSNVQLRLVRPQLSVAKQTTARTPTGNRLPEAGEQVMSGAGSKLSVAVGVGYVTTMGLVPHVQRQTSPGQMIEGPVTSRRTAMVKVQNCVTQPSWARQVMTFVVFTLKSEPDAGVQERTMLLLHPPVTDGNANVTGRAVVPHVHTVRLVGQVMTSGLAA